MPRDYRETIRALRAKADDPVVPEAERKALRDRADAMEAKHFPRNSNPRPAGESVITDRSGHSTFFHAQPRPMTVDEFLYYFNPDAYRARQRAEAMRQTEDLFRRQHQWNRPPEYDEDILIPKEYKTDTSHPFHTSDDDEDAGYDEWISGEYD